MRARFGSFTLDSTTRQLLRGDDEVRISTKAFDLMHQLIGSRPRVVPKQEMLELLWPGTFVSDGTLAGVVTELRAALGDDARKPQFIRTVHRIGYAFCGDVATEAAAENQRAYRLLWGTRELQLGGGPNMLGRDKTAVAWIDHPSISRRHAVIHISDSQATVEDLGSKNGTFVNGKRARGKRLLEDGDDVMFGSVPMKFRVFDEGAPTESVL